ncbi:MAG: DoxX family protein [Acidobacteria bacterium]|nr:DoxX family protein [Acidobacteriota bacterium]
MLRLVVGAVFVSHGMLKLWPEFAGPAETTALLTSLGFKLPYLVAFALGSVELVGGVVLAVGAYTGWTAIALLQTTVVMSWKLHVSNGRFLNWATDPASVHGAEFDLVLAGALLSLLVTGAGHLSFDRARRHAADREAAGLARLRRG